MKILDANGNEIKNPDLTKGYLKSETILIKHHPAVKYRPERAHWATEISSLTGKSVVVRIVDSPEVKARKAWDETEEIQRYIEYSTEELRLIAEYLSETSSMTRKELTERAKDTEYALLDLAEVSDKNEKEISENEDALLEHEAALAELGELASSNEQSAKDNEEALLDLAEMAQNNETEIIKGAENQNDNETAILELGELLSSALDKITILETEVQALRSSLDTSTSDDGGNA